MEAEVDVIGVGGGVPEVVVGTCVLVGREPLSLFEFVPHAVKIKNDMKNNRYL
jgi:hypothetical protein